MKIRGVHLLSIGLGFALLGAGPCGGGGQSADTDDFQGTDKDVAQAVYDFRDAVAKRDESKICDTYFTPDLKAKVAADGKAAGRGDTCAKAIEDPIADIDATDIKVKSVDVTGTTATVTVTTDLSKGADASNTLKLVNERGWRISELP
jgi:hypothetical protein